MPPGGTDCSDGLVFHWLCQKPPLSCWHRASPLQMAEMGKAFFLVHTSRGFVSSFITAGHSPSPVLQSHSERPCDKQRCASSHNSWSSKRALSNKRSPNLGTCFFIRSSWQISYPILQPSTGPGCGSQERRLRPPQRKHHSKSSENWRVRQTAAASAQGSGFKPVTCPFCPCSPSPKALLDFSCHPHSHSQQPGV